MSILKYHSPSGEGTPRVLLDQELVPGFRNRTVELEVRKDQEILGRQFSFGKDCRCWFKSKVVIKCWSNSARQAASLE